MPKRIALLGLYHESNTFIETPTTLDHFQQSHWFFGADIRREYAGAHHEIGGMLAILDACDGVECLPVMYAEATPGGMVTAEAYQYLLDQLMHHLDELGPIDGCMVVPHGAGVSGNQPDMDGHWLGVLRTKLGPAVPIIGTLDPHANVSQAMIDATDALVAYCTNPHIDQRETGRKAAILMLWALQTGQKPVQHLVSLPLVISIEQQHTAQPPCKSVYDYVDLYRQQAGVLSISVLLGFPYADVPEMGSAFIVVTTEDRQQAVGIGQELATYILTRKTAFNGPKADIVALLPRLASAARPILLLDMGDNIGGGSPGNSTLILETLENHAPCRTFVYLHDQEAAQQARAYPLNAVFTLPVGRHPVTGAAYQTTVTLVQKIDGHFTEDSPRHGGQTHYNMGPTALLRTQTGTIIMVSTYRIPPFSLRQLTAFGLDPASFDILIAKGVNAPMAAYAPVCATIFQVDTPGVTQADMTRLPFMNRRKPLFPFET